MNHTLRNRIIGIVLIAAMSAGLIISGLSVLLAQKKTDDGAKQNSSQVQEQTKTENNTDSGDAGSAGSESAEDTAAAREAVTGYFSAIRNGDVDEAYTYVAEKPAADTFALNDKKDSFMQTAKDQPDYARKILEDYFKASAKQYVRSYAIEQSARSGDENAFLVRVTMGDFSQIKDLDPSVYSQQMQEYINTHLDELNQMTAEQGQAAADAYLQEMQMTSYYNDMKKELENLPDTDLKFEVITTKNADGTRSIVSIEPQAGQQASQLPTPAIPSL